MIELNRTLESYIEYRQRNHREVIFVQIGSNNGRNGDPLFELVCRYQLGGVLIEPVKYLFEELKENYRNCTDLHFVNVAIGNVDENLAFYRLKKSDNPDLPEWYEQLGSFRKEVILRHVDAIPDIEERIIEENVETVTFSQLLSGLGISQVPLVHIDTEGFDYEIIKTIDFRSYGVEFLLYEHKHLSRSDVEACSKHLRDLGYDLFPLKRDTLAIAPSVHPHLLAAGGNQAVLAGREENRSTANDRENLTKPDLAGPLVAELNEFIFDELARIETIEIGCIVTKTYVFDLLICYGSIVDSWNFYPFVLNVFTLERDTAAQIESFNLPNIRVHYLGHLVDRLDWGAGAGFKVRLVEHSGLEKCLVTDVDNLFLADTPEIWGYLDNHDFVFIGAPHSSYLIQTNFWGFHRSATAIEFADEWHRESLGRQYADASGLQFALYQNRSNRNLRVKALVQKKASPEADHHPCPYDIQANVRPFRLFRDTLGFRADQMGRAKVLHLAGFRSHHRESVAARLTAILENFPESFEVFEYYAGLANRAARILEIPELNDPLEFLRRTVDPADLPPGSYLRQRLVLGHLFEGMRESHL